MVSKVVIFAGGLGSRLAEETHDKPKPMVEIGGIPIIWHIMRIYAHYGLTNFIICLGYKGYLVKEYFANYHLHNSNITCTLDEHGAHILKNRAEPWKVSLIDTGLNAETGSRLKKVANYLSMDEDFCLTYGDGVADINIAELIKFHNQQRTLATVTAVRPPPRFGKLTIQDNLATTFAEKISHDNDWISGGFFVLSPKVIDLIPDVDQVSFEQDTLKLLASQHQLSAYKHHGFWQPMDTLKEKKQLHEYWIQNQAPWKMWQG